MISELKMIIDLLEGMPELAMWALVFFLGYKLVMYLAVTGTIYKLASLAIHKIHDMYVKDKPVRPIVEVKREVVNVIKERKGIRSLALNEEVYGEMVRLLERVKAREGNSGLTYLHTSDVEWLELAIEAKIYAEA